MMLSLVELLVINTFWICIVLCRKASRDNIVNYFKKKTVFLEDILWQVKGRK